MKEILEKYCKFCQDPNNFRKFYSINLFNLVIIENKVELWSGGIRHNTFTSPEKLEMFLKSLK